MPRIKARVARATGGEIGGGEGNKSCDTEKNNSCNTGKWIVFSSEHLVNNNVKAREGERDIYYCMGEGQRRSMTVSMHFVSM